jgi:hypothetical protein
MAVFPDPSGLQEPSDLAAPSLAEAATRAALTPAARVGFLRLCQLWDLTAPDGRALLGGLSERSWFRLKGDAWAGMLSQDELTRISLLIGIFKGLRLLFSSPLAEDWIQLPNTSPLFAGQSPLTLMRAGGIPAMLQVRRHLDALRGGL